MWNKNASKSKFIGISIKDREDGYEYGIKNIKMPKEYVPGKTKMPGLYAQKAKFTAYE